MKTSIILLLIYAFGCATPMNTSKTPSKSFLNCPKTHFKGWKDGESWSFQDKEVFSVNKDRCIKKFPNSPCLVIFEKKRPGAYRGVCGKELE